MTMSSVLHQTLTAYEFWQLPDSGVGRELRRGEVIETMPPGGQHGAIAVILAMLLRLWTKRTTADMWVKFAILPVRFPQSHNGYVERIGQTKEVDAYNPNELVCSHLA